MGSVDETFIQEQEHRPKLSNTCGDEDIPLIDLSPLQHHHKASIDSLVSEIGNSCKKWGFFQVINHGVDIQKRQNLETSAKKFFALSTEEKQKVRKRENQVMGYNDSEHTKNVKDWKEVFDFVTSDPFLLPVSPDPDDDRIYEVHNIWPQNPPELKDVCGEYVEEMKKLGYKLLELIAMSLGLEAKRFHRFYEQNQTTYMRINYYRPCPAPELALGFGRHKDSGVLTILCQDDVGGLQVRRKADGEWVNVKPVPDAYIINIGDLFQAWTNGIYESVEHRVVASSEKERLSIPFFLYPAQDTLVEPLEELVNEENPAKYTPYYWGKFFMSTRYSNYKKTDEDDIQITDFVRIPSSSGTLPQL